MKDKKHQKDTWHGAKNLAKDAYKVRLSEQVSHPMTRIFCIALCTSLLHFPVPN